MSQGSRDASVLPQDDAAPILGPGRDAARPPRLWAVAIAAIAVAAATAATVVGLGMGGHRPSTRAARPGRSTDQAGTRRVEVPSFVALSRDGRTLRLDGVGGACGNPEPNRLVVTATTRRVALTLWVRGPTHLPTICLTGTFGRPPLLSVRLAAPLGRRPVVQGLTGRRIEVFGGAVLARPTVLPRGCVLGAVIPAKDILTSGPPDPLGLHPGVHWTCDVAVAFRATQWGPASTLDVGQWRGWIRSLGLPIERRTRVHGHPALLKVQRINNVWTIQARSISWRQDGETFVISSYSGLTPSRRHSRSVLSGRELLAIANGLVIPAPAATG